MVILKNCPFCRGQAAFDVKSNFSSHCEVGFKFVIKCIECKIVFPKEGTVSLRMDSLGNIEYITDDRMDLITKWNSRSSEEEDREDD